MHAKYREIVARLQKKTILLPITQLQNYFPTPPPPNHRHALMNFLCDPQNSNQAISQHTLPTTNTTSSQYGTKSNLLKKWLPQAQSYKRVKSDFKQQQLKYQTKIDQKLKVQYKSPANTYSNQSKTNYHIQQQHKLDYSPAVAKHMKKNYILGDVNQWTSKNIVDLDSILHNIFGLRSFRNNQKAIINCTISNIDLFVCMPTGGGKSLTFQLPTFFQTGLTLVIAPLVSLIKDQEQQAKSYGIDAYSLTSQTPASIQNQIYSNIVKFNYKSKLLFCTPQRIVKSSRLVYALDILYNQKGLRRFVIDQAHCVSTWGKDFRKDYLQLGFLKGKYPGVPLIALTATATQVVKIDAIQRLAIKNCLYFQCSFNRPNLFYQVKPKGRNLLKQIINFIKQRKKQSGIIYCSSRKECNQLQEQLNLVGIRAGQYHAQIPQAQRSRTQDLWMLDQIQVIVATIAFGMGINKPDVRFVIHHSFPKSLQNYYQQSGRAGRDGQPAVCLLFYRASDRTSHYFHAQRNQNSTIGFKNQSLRHIFLMMKYCQDNVTCRKQLQLSHLGQKFDKSRCNKMCDNCSHPKPFTSINRTKEGIILANLIMKMAQCHQPCTSNQLLQILDGKKPKKNIANRLKHLQRKGVDIDIDWQIDKTQTQSLIMQLIFEQLVFQKFMKGKGGFSYTCLIAKKNKIENFQKSGKKIILKKIDQDIENDQIIEDIKKKGKFKKKKKNTSQKMGQFLHKYQQTKAQETKQDFKMSIFQQCKYKESKIKHTQSNKFGHCHTQQQFDDIYGRIKQARKNLFYKLKMQGSLGDCSNIQVLVPNDLLINIAKQLPTSMQELQNMSLGRFKQLLTNNSVFFLPSIHCFLQQYGIIKQDKQQSKTYQQQGVFQFRNFIVQNDLKQSDSQDDFQDVIQFIFKKSEQSQTTKQSQFLLQMQAQKRMAKSAGLNQIMQDIQSQSDQAS